MKSDAPRRRSWKILAVLLGGMAAGVLSLWLWAERVIARKWMAMEGATERWIAEARSRDTNRPILEGEPLSGNAWDDHALALKDIGNPLVGLELRDFIDRVNLRRGSFDRKAVEAFVGAHGTALEYWDRGMRRAQSRYSRDWETILIDDQSGAFSLAALVACKARLLSEEGRLPEAADLLLRLGLFARDTGHNCFGYQSGWVSKILAFSLNGLRDLLLSRRLAEGDLERVERGLEFLDRLYDRRGFDLLNERIRFGLAFTRYGPQGVLSPMHSSKATWRYLFSPRLMAAQACESVARWYARMAEAEAMSWKDECRVRQEIEREARASPNPMFEGERVTGYGCTMRLRLAQLRLLRVTAHYLATAKVLNLEDPFGTTLLHSEANGTLVVWSISVNGVDDSAKGHWEPSVYGRIPDDLVLEVKR